jgi:hypothetical protein
MPLFTLLLHHIKLVAKRHYIIMSYSEDDNPDLMKKAATLGPTITNVWRNMSLYATIGAIEVSSHSS